MYAFGLCNVLPDWTTPALLLKVSDLVPRRVPFGMDPR